MSAYTNFVAEIRGMIAPHLRADLDADRYAAVQAEELDYFEETAHFEIRGGHTKSGAPVTLTIKIPEELRAAEGE